MAHHNTRSVRALDALAFLAPDVQGGVGPFLVVFMSAALHWDAALGRRGRRRGGRAHERRSPGTNLHIGPEAAARVGLCNLGSLAQIARLQK